MPRVIVDRKDSKLEEAAESCPVSAFKKCANGEYVINPNVCIDCGVCQTVADNGAIVEDSEASEEDIKYNEENAQ